jgi:hypothetical protein
MAMNKLRKSDLALRALQVLATCLMAWQAAELGYAAGRAMDATTPAVAAAIHFPPPGTP